MIRDPRSIARAVAQHIRLYLLLSCAAPLPLYAATATYGSSSPGDMAACRSAAARAEQEQGLPAGLLLAIGRQESGRRDVTSGELTPWPFATNMAGESRFFSTGAEAIDHVAEWQRSGVRSIDVGCFQINLRHHPDAFANLRDAFDPLANARYAAHFLLTLHAETGSWEAAVGRYHSATYSLAEPYTAAVLNLWHQPAGPTLPQFRAAEPLRQSVSGVFVQRPGAYLNSGGGASRLANLPRVITPTGR
jgi:hypothetical protein